MPGRGTASARDRLVGPTLHRARVVAQRGASEVSGAETHGAWTDSASRPGHASKVMGVDKTHFKKVALATGVGNGLDGAGESGDRACGDTGGRGLSG